MNDLICWHDGHFTNLESVKVSVLDFGFIHCDATYDVLRVLDQKIKFYDLHARRFEESCLYYGFEPIADLKNTIEDLITKNDIVDAFAWACVWRGSPPSGSPRDMNGPQHSLVYVKPYYPIAQDGQVSLTIDKDHRRVPDVCFGQKYKNFSWIELSLAQKVANKRNFDSVIVLSVDGFISEGPGFGICFVKEGVVFTPQKDCLHSVTISVVEDICSKNNIRFERKDIDVEEAMSADEAFICSTSGGITLVSQLDGKIFAHSISEQIRRIYDRY